MTPIVQKYAVAALRGVQLCKRLLHRYDGRVNAVRREREAFYDRAWTEAARVLGAEIRALDPSLWQISREDCHTFVYLNYTNFDDPVTLRVAGNKAVVHELVSAAGLPVPPHLRFSLRTIEQAMRFLEQAGTPCVVKPMRGTGAGQGVTTGIRTRRQLLWGAATAASYQSDLLIEKELAGANYRLLYLDGALIDVVRRDPPKVQGDGRSTVRALLGHMNQRRLSDGFGAAQTLLLYDREMKHTLARQGLSLRSVPAPGAEVLLKVVVNDNQASDNVEARRELCDDIIDAGARAARAVNVRLAGVDIITPDPAVALESGGGVVLEVNTTPGYHMHYHRRSEPCRVAEVVLARLLDEARQSPAINLSASATRQERRSFMPQWRTS